MNPRAADIGEPVREVEIPATEPAWNVPEPAEVPDCTCPEPEHPRHGAVGVIRMTGRGVEHDDGWRSQHAELVALVDHSNRVRRDYWVPRYRTTAEMYAEWAPGHGGLGRPARRLLVRPRQVDAVSPRACRRLPRGSPSTSRRTAGIPAANGYSPSTPAASSKSRRKRKGWRR